MSEPKPAYVTTNSVQEDDNNRQLLLALRRALLLFVDALERHLDIDPRTAHTRK